MEYVCFYDYDFITVKSFAQYLELVMQLWDNKVKKNYFQVSLFILMSRNLNNENCLEYR